MEAFLQALRIMMDMPRADGPSSYRIVTGHPNSGKFYRQDFYVADGPIRGPLLRNWGTSSSSYYIHEPLSLARES